jgi:2'-5' RNA ligase
MRRFFIAIPLLPETAEMLFDMTPEGIGIQVVPPENHHLTLRYLGELPETTFIEVREALEEVEFPRFEIFFQAFGFFPSAHKPKVLWAGAQPTTTLELLQKSVDRALGNCQVILDKRPYRPHITLARLNGADDLALASFLQTHHEWRAPEVTVTGFSLFESKQGSRGPHYEIQAEYRLGSVMDFLLE